MPLLSISMSPFLLSDSSKNIKASVTDLKTFLSRQAKKQEKRLEQPQVQQQPVIAGSRTEERFVSNGLQEQLVNASQGGMAGGTLQGLLLAGVQDQGGALAVAQLQALTLDENQPQLSQQVISDIAPSNPAANCDHGVQSPLSWAEALGQVGQVDGGGWEGAGPEASNLFQELATLQ